MNARLSVPVALAVGAVVGSLLSHALPPAQAQDTSRSLDAKVARLESRVDALQAQVNQLKAKNPVTVGNSISPFYPPGPLPRQSNLPPFQITLLGQSAR